MLEPGRSLVGNAGVLLTTVQYLKHAEARNFAIVDAAMNDLLRPALYEAYHGLLPGEAACRRPLQKYDVVGPVCESGDWLAKQRALCVKQRRRAGAWSRPGAYGMAMAGNYNSRPRARRGDGRRRQVHACAARDAGGPAAGASLRCLDGGDAVF